MTFALASSFVILAVLAATTRAPGVLESAFAPSDFDLEPDPGAGGVAARAARRAGPRDDRAADRRAADRNPVALDEGTLVPAVHLSVL